MSSFSTRYQWQATSGSASPITGNTAVTVQATATAAQLALGYPTNLALTDLEMVNTSATVPTVVNLVSNSVVLATYYLPASTVALVQVPVQANYTTPIQAGKGNGFTLQAVTTGANIYWNARGFFFTN